MYEQAKIQVFNILIHILNDSRLKFHKSNKLDLFLCLLNQYKIKNYLKAIYAIRRMGQHS